MRLDKYASILRAMIKRDLQRLGELLSLLNRTLADDESIVCVWNGQKMASAYREIPVEARRKKSIKFVAPH